RSLPEGRDRRRCSDLPPHDPRPDQHRIRPDARAGRHPHRRRVRLRRAPTMNLERTESPGWLSNAYLIDDGAGTGVLIDGNGVAAPLLDAVAERDLRIPAVLLTHHHADHVVLDDYRELGAEVYAHELTAAELPSVVDALLTDGETVEFGGLSIECLH